MASFAAAPGAGERSFQDYPHDQCVLQCNSNRWVWQKAAVFPAEPISTFLFGVSSCPRKRASTSLNLDPRFRGDDGAAPLLGTAACARIAPKLKACG